MGIRSQSWPGVGAQDRQCIPARFGTGVNYPLLLVGSLQGQQRPHTPVGRRGLLRPETVTSRLLACNFSRTGLWLRAILRDMAFFVAIVTFPLRSVLHRG